MKFRLIDLFWLVAVLAVFFAWYGDRRNCLSVIDTLENKVVDQDRDLFLQQKKYNSLLQDWYVKDKDIYIYGLNKD